MSADESMLLRLLEALSNPLLADHKASLQFIETHVQDGAFVSTIVTFFGNGGASPFRQLAGLVIKNYLAPSFTSYTPALQQTIKHACLHVLLSEENHEVQTAAALVFGRVVQTSPFDLWQDTLPILFERIAPLLPQNQVRGALRALLFVCEDSGEQLCRVNNGEVIPLLLPKLLAIFPSPDVVVRLHALLSINALLLLLPAVDDRELHMMLQPDAQAQLLAQHPNAHMLRASFLVASALDQLLQGVSSLAMDSSADIRCAVCRSVVVLTTTFSGVSAFRQLFPSICEFMLKSVSDANEQVAMEACEFWASLVGDESQAQTVITYLPQLIPVVMARMVLTEAQLQRERSDALAHASGEKDIQFKPIHHRGADDRKDEEEAAAQYTVRMQAAALLDKIGCNFEPSLVLSVAFPEVEQCLKSANVWQREAGMLALGSLSNGCMEGMSPYLHNIFPYFLSNLADEVIEMRCICCWILGRYCDWLFDPRIESGYDLFRASLLGLSQRLMDGEPKVQSAALSALCCLVDVAGLEVVPFLRDLFSVFQRCFTAYGVKASMQLIDLIGAVAGAVGEELAQPDLVAMFMPTLMQRLSQLDNDDMHLFPLLEAFTYITVSLGMSIAPFALALADRCLAITRDTLLAYAQQQQQLGNRDDGDEPPVKDFAICGLDVLTGLCEGLREQFAVLIGDKASLLLQLVVSAARDSLPELRQSAVLLIGEMAKSSPQLIVAGELLAPLLELAVSNIDDDTPALCSNSIWTVGEIAVRFGGGVMEPHLGRICTRMLGVLHRPHDDNNNNNGPSLTMLQNIGITFGRLCATNTNTMTQVLAESFLEVCNCVKLAPMTSERQQAFSGIVAVLTVNPTMLLLSSNNNNNSNNNNRSNSNSSNDNSSNALAFLIACSTWEEEPEEPLLGQLRLLLLQLQQELTPPVFLRLLKRLDRQLQQQLVDVFRIQTK